jgi:coenzyme F420-0:L-glutamate ligase/coenzyme F420-1:gamma-L-glutamate ligase
VTTPSFAAFALPGIPLINPNDSLADLIAAAAAAHEPLRDGDVVVVSSKIVSKAEGRYAYLSRVQVSAEAEYFAQITGKDPRLVQLILDESRGVSRAAFGVLVTQHRLGFVSANAGIDQSNIEHSEERVLLLPLDPDASADALRERLQALTGCELAVIISDTHGRPFRFGNVGVAIGVSGMQALVDMRGRPDLFGRELLITQQGYADLVASAAHLLCGEAAEGYPVVILRGLDFPRGAGRASDLNRPPEKDLYR